MGHRDNKLTSSLCVEITPGTYCMLCPPQPCYCEFDVLTVNIHDLEMYPDQPHNSVWWTELFFPSVTHKELPTRVIIMEEMILSCGIISHMMTSQ